MTCKRSQGYLAQVNAKIVEQVNAAKDKLGPEAALHAVRAAKDLYVAKGQRVVHLDLAKQTPTDEELLALVIGPSGNLRAPTLRRGKKLYVGFHPTEFPKLLSP